MVQALHYRSSFFTCLLALSLIAVLSSNVEAVTHRHKWEVNYGYKSPDCYKKLAITVNGESPGPTIHAQQGDTIVVELNNALFSENVAVHWHGIRQVVMFH